jgi:ACS family allantoate permease-like MFS transporter
MSLTGATQTAPYVTVVSLPQANSAGSTQKVVTYCILGYAAGNLIGPQTFHAEQAPQYMGGTVAMLTCYCVAILLMGLYSIVTSWENRRKDRKYGTSLRVDQDSIRDLVEVFQDLSDKQQKDFRYILDFSGAA